MRICVSSSCPFERDWKKIQDKFRGHQFTVVTPEVQDLDGKTKAEANKLMEFVDRRFFHEIEIADILYIWCPKGYIGKGVAAEIGYAIAKGKTVVSSERIDDQGIWSIVSIVKDLDEFYDFCSEQLRNA